MLLLRWAVGALPGYARIMHGLTLSIKENDYVMAERSMGAVNWKIMLSHILPNALPPMIVLITLQLGALSWRKPG